MDKEGRHDEEMVKAIDDVVAKETGAQISYDDEHHSIFAFGKCTVENHATVLNVSPYKVNIWINDLLEELAKDSTDQAALGLVCLLPDFILSICSDTWLLISLRKRRR